MRLFRLSPDMGEWMYVCIKHTLIYNDYKGIEKNDNTGGIFEVKLLAFTFIFLRIFIVSKFFTMSI